MTSPDETFWRTFTTDHAAAATYADLTTEARSLPPAPHDAAGSRTWAARAVEALRHADTTARKTAADLYRVEGYSASARRVSIFGVRCAATAHRIEGHLTNTTGDTP